MTKAVKNNADKKRNDSKRTCKTAWVIDNEYKGDNDIWKCKCEKAFFSRIYRYERLFQFKIVKNMEMFRLKEVKHLGNDNRGGYGSTGKF